MLLQIGSFSLSPPRFLSNMLSKDVWVHLIHSTAYSFQTWLPALGHMRLAGFLPYFLIGL